MTDPRQDPPRQDPPQPPAPHRVLPLRRRTPRWPYSRWCPKCKGTGQVPAPWSLWRTVKTCPACGGERIVATQTIGLWWGGQRSYRRWRAWHRRRHGGA